MNVGDGSKLWPRLLAAVSPRGVSGDTALSTQGKGWEGRAGWGRGGERSHRPLKGLEQGPGEGGRGGHNLGSDGEGGLNPKLCEWQTRNPLRASGPAAVRGNGSGSDRVEGELSVERGARNNKCLVNGTGSFSFRCLVVCVASEREYRMPGCKRV